MAGDRELRFFSGTAHGAAVPGFSYMSGNMAVRTARGGGWIRPHERVDLSRWPAQLVVGVLTAQLMTPAAPEAGAAAAELRFLRLPESGAQSTAECDPLASSGACVHSSSTTKTCTYCRRSDLQ